MEQKNRNSQLSAQTPLAGKHQRRILQHTTPGTVSTITWFGVPSTAALC